MDRRVLRDETYEAESKRENVLRSCESQGPFELKPFQDCDAFFRVHGRDDKQNGPKYILTNEIIQLSKYSRKCGQKQLSDQISDSAQEVLVKLPAPLVRKLVDLDHIGFNRENLSDEVAKLLRGAIAFREAEDQKGSSDPDSEEIRARLLKLGYI